jgi:hypothetical protein
MLSKTFATGFGDFYPQTEMQSDATLFRIIQWSPFQLKCFWLGKLDATSYFNPPSGGLPRAAPGPQGVFFSTSGVIGTPKNSKKTENISRNEILCRFFENRVIWALSCWDLNKIAGQS